ncbi:MULTISPECIES: glycosyltransferase [unclassified Thioalkalivibrio]|uniref:glycosyltransferase n=1 Tax=unclassified Thioalkalivibrio TaxID=2621013 RepID=UPI0003776342|nr:MULTISPECIES: glycosyltransferase [unclassified Thioalkalivibrio]
MADTTDTPASTHRTRVLMTTSTLPRWEGDTEPRFVLDLARSLDAQCDVELLAPHAPGAARRETLEGVAVSRFRYWIPAWQAAAYEGGMVQRLRRRPWRVLQLPIFLLSQTLAIARRLRRKSDVDLIHAHWIVPQGLAAIIGRALAGKPDVPILCTSHGGDLFGLQKGWMQRLKRWIVSRCDATTVVSEAMVAPMQTLGSRHPPEVIPMGTDLQGLFTPGGKTSTRREPNHLIFVGRLVEKKGVHVLLDALAMFDADKRPDLDIVGEGPLRPALEERVRKLGIEPSVRFVGAIPHSRLPEYYRRASVAVFPFVQASDGDQEGFGLVMVEAMGCGCAVIASDLPAVRQVIPTTEHAVLSPPFDHQALFEQIRRTLEDPEHRAQIALQGRRFVLERFDRDVTRDAFACLYQTLASPGTNKTSHSPDR